jgi:hypothetical protein
MTERWMAMVISSFLCAPEIGTDASRSTVLGLRFVTAINQSKRDRKSALSPDDLTA